MLKNNFLQAVAVMLGCIIGVGIFGLPYLTQKAGVASFLFLIVFFGTIQYFVHLIFANVVLATKTYHRLPGYAEIYLGKRAKNLTMIVNLVSSYGALLAYIIVGGIFLNQLLSPFLGDNEFLLASILFFIKALIVYFGIGVLSKVELLMTLFLVFIIFLLAIKGMPYFELANFKMLRSTDFLSPYGAVLFAIAGAGAVPIVVRLLNRDKEKIKKAIFLGTYGSVFFTIMFTLIVVGVSGDNVSPDALSGLAKIMGDNIIKISLVFGILTLFTSFLVIAEEIKDLYERDYGISRFPAWALAVFFPYALYISGMQNFIKVISLVGGVTGGIIIIILLTLFKKMMKNKKNHYYFKKGINNNLLKFLLIIFSLGIIYEIYEFFIK